jgi:mannose-6-phosphate isomerase-like protein (cupin superfamily)
MIRKQNEMAVEERLNSHGGPGKMLIKHYFRSNEFTAKCRMCAKLTLSPGSGIGLHKHAADDEIFIILKGEGILDEGTTKTKVREGDAILTGNGASHAVTNDGKTDLEMAAVIITY